MKKSIALITVLCAAFLLSGCVSREQADTSLAKGCEAGVKALLPDGTTIDHIKESNFTPSPEGPTMRHVKLTAIIMDGWLETEKVYECIFDESFSFLNMGHTASVHQIRLDDEIYGKVGGEIVGDTEGFVKLTDAIRAAMYGD